MREQSETEELCRLLLPSAWLYYATGKAEDKALLYTLVHPSLEKMRHPSGAYLEWDSDYSAACSRQDGWRMFPAEPQRRPCGQICCTATTGCLWV